jgi:hypothetical protein
LKLVWNNFLAAAIKSHVPILAVPIYVYTVLLTVDNDLFGSLKRITFISFTKVSNFNILHYLLNASETNLGMYSLPW